MRFLIALLVFVGMPFQAMGISGPTLGGPWSNCLEVYWGGRQDAYDIRYRKGTETNGNPDFDAWITDAMLTNIPSDVDLIRITGVTPETIYQIEGRTYVSGDGVDDGWLYPPVTATTAMADEFACDLDEPVDRTVPFPGTTLPMKMDSVPPTCPHTPADPQALTDKDVLITLYCATGGDSWTNSDDWGSDKSLNDWHGVTANPDGTPNDNSDDVVTELNLTNNNLAGEIPSELEHLADLVLLYLNMNELTGMIPPELGSLPALVRLDLSNNDLSGTVPMELEDLTDTLWVLGIWGNDRLDWTGLSNELFKRVEHLALNRFYQKTGGPNWTIDTGWPLASSLALFTFYGVTVDSDGRVTGLALGNNNLTGELPVELAQLTRLETMDLSVNQLSGPVPPELSDLASLRILKLYSNQLSCELPAGFNNLSNLEDVDITCTAITPPPNPPAWLRKGHCGVPVEIVCSSSSPRGGGGGSGNTPPQSQPQGGGGGGGGGNFGGGGGTTPPPPVTEPQVDQPQEDPPPVGEPDPEPVIRQVVTKTAGGCSVATAEDESGFNLLLLLLVVLAPAWWRTSQKQTDIQ